MTASFYHLVLFGLEKTVVDSQLVTPAHKLFDSGIPVRLMIFEDVRKWFRLLNSQNRRDYNLRLGRLEAVLFPRIPRNFLWANTFLIGLWLFPALLRGRKVVIHARGFQGANTVLLIKRIFRSLRLICDARGLEAEEFIYSVMAVHGRLHWYHRYWGCCLARKSQRVLKRADAVFSVSSAMRTHLMNWVGATDEAKWERVPCAVDVGMFDQELAERRRRREEWGVTNRLVVVFSGACRAWQLPEKSVEVFKNIQKLAPRAFFLCLTPDVDQFLSLLQTHGLKKEDFLVKKVLFSDVPKHLVAGDLGLLLREENPLNTYACPTKFAEYLACGLHVLATKAIRDVADVIRSEGVGTLVEDLADPRSFEEALMKAIRVSELEMTRIERSVSTARRFYDWGRYIPLIKKWYLQLAQIS